MSRRALLPVLLAILSGCGGADRRDRPPSAAAQRASTASPAVVVEKCSTRWIGPRQGGDWHESDYWSAHREPGSSDEACVPRGTTVTISSGAAHVGALVDGGGLTMKGGSLELASVDTASEVSVLRLERGATLYGSGNLIVARSLKMLGGTMAGGSGAPRSSGPALTPCGPDSPRGVPDCAAAAPLDERAVRRTWRRFLHLLNSNGNPGAIAAMLTPRACLIMGHRVPRSTRARRAACLRTAHALLTDPTVSRFSPHITNLMIDGNYAYGDALAAGNVRFVRRRGRWRIFMFASYGWPD